jgi:hypothetical protein
MTSVDRIGSTVVNNRSLMYNIAQLTHGHHLAFMQECHLAVISETGNDDELDV